MNYAQIAKVLKNNNDFEQMLFFEFFSKFVLQCIQFYWKKCNVFFFSFLGQQEKQKINKQTVKLFCVSYPLFFFLIPKFRFVLVFNAIVFERSRTKRKKYIFLPKCTLFSCYALRPYPDSVHYFSSSLLFRLSNNLQHSFDC